MRFVYGRGGEMCERDHRPESYTFGGMQVVICDDAPEGGLAMPPEVTSSAAGANWDRPISLSDTP